MPEAGDRGQVAVLLLGRVVRLRRDRARACVHLPYNKVCNIEDFRDPQLEAALREVFPHDFLRYGDTFPSGREYRKHWEVAMTARAFSDLGVLTPDAEVLGVGAGTEPTIFWLTRRVRRVFATDIYLDSGVWTAK